MSTQEAFRAALLDASQPVPDGLLDGQGRPAGRRYSVYRNNVALSLRDALSAGFPAVQKLIGEENFAHVAGLFLRHSPPTSPMMQLYGDGFPEFLADFEPAKKIGYLADVARLELAQRRSYHAGDAEPIDPAALQSLGEDALLSARFKLAPAVRVLRSPWPVLSIYNFTMTPGGPKPEAVPDDVLITRPLHDPILRKLSENGAAFVTELGKGSSFGTVLEQMGEGFDLPQVLGLLLEGGALCDMTIGKDT